MPVRIAVEACLLLLVPLSAFSSPIAEIVCRGGSGVATEKSVTFSPSPQGVTTLAFINVHGLFKNQMPAIGNGDNLAPGTCAWRDRPMSPSEPTLIHVNLNAMTSPNASIQISSYDTNTSSAKSIVGDPFEALRSDAYTVSMFVTNVSNSYMDVSGTHPIAKIKIK